jgi:nitroimidazol reductase NimA-like FMN-containing flavoprotein (pyridoxamine 5'-phosphate oxidase superfamily)
MVGLYAAGPEVPEMTDLDASITSLLERPLVATIATAGTTPHAVPVWYRHAKSPSGGDEFRIWSDRSRHWVSRIARNPKVQVVVAESAVPFAGVIASGTALLIGEAVLEEATRICARYVGEGEAPAYVRTWSTLDTIVVVEVEQIRGWARGY